MKVPLRVLQIGPIAVVLAVTLHRAFELDRFLIPKELVLHATALVAGVAAFGALRRMVWTRVDQLLAVYLAVSAVSVVFATNRWVGWRAFAVSASAILIFWVARVLREAGLAPALLRGLALAIVVAAITSLLQTYGVELELFSVNRAPGGTLGNRNFIGHTAAFGLPVLLFVLLTAQRVTLAAAGVALTMMALVLTRSRAAWLAAAAVFVIFIAGSLVARAWKRFAVVLIAAVIGVAAALLIPNALHWRSDNPYLQSMKSVTNYEKGSGAGRLIQYQRSLFMAAMHPLLGVGPGNWPVRYPHYAARNDPSLDESEPRMTFNPWPSSDWIAILSERGFAAALALAIAAVMIALTALRSDDRLQATALIATLAAAAIAGAFDAVLLLAEPTLLVFATLGALFVPAEPRTRGRLAPLLVLIVAFLGVIRSASQIAAMELFTRGSRSSLEQAATLDPGNFRVQLRLARIGKRAERCEHARAAAALFPTSAAAASAARGCE